jgi:hypothetical protein
MTLPGPAAPRNPNDRIRDKILQYFYDRNANATSRYGKKGSAVRISDVKRDLKGRYQLSQQEVVSNLTYLIDQGWINTFEVEKTVSVAGGTIPSRVAWYEISATGIDRIEEGSSFSRSKFDGINISALGHNVITVGDGNVVDVRFKQIHQELATLEEAIRKHPTLDDRTKLDSVSDIESLQGQLAKNHPDRKVLELLWANISEVAAGIGLVELAARIGLAIGAAPM